MNFRSYPIQPMRLHYIVAIYLIVAGASPHD